MIKKYRTVQHKNGRRYVVKHIVYSDGRHSQPEVLFEFEQVAPDWFRARVAGFKEWAIGCNSLSGIIKTMEGWYE
jgi:hypothetical protein